VICSDLRRTNDDAVAVDAVLYASTTATTLTSATPSHHLLCADPLPSAETGLGYSVQET